MKIKYEVLAAMPNFFKEEISLANLDEEKYIYTRRWSKFQSNQSITVEIHTILYSPQNTRYKPNQRPNQYTKLTPTEIGTRRNNDLCYTCDKKWFQGH